MFCSNCGRKQNQGDAFCPSCGIRQDLEILSTLKNTEHQPAEQTSDSTAPDPILSVSGSTEQKSTNPTTRKKPIWIIAGVTSGLLMIVILIVAVVVLNNPVQRYKRAYKDSDSERMLQIYTDSIQNDKERVKAIREYLELEADKLLESFEQESITYDEAYDQLQIITDSSLRETVYITEVWQRINHLYEVRTNFENGKEALQNENYQDAIVYFSQMGDDTRYSAEAEEHLSVARSAYRNLVLASVDEHVKNGDLTSALYELDHAISRHLTSDGQIIQRRNEIMAVIEESVNAIGNTSGNLANGGLAAIQGDWIYYVSWDGNYSAGNIFKINTDGTGLTQITDQTCNFINVVDDWVYYCNHNDYLRAYKTKTDGTETTKVNDDGSTEISVAGNWIYYLNWEDRSKVYKIRTNGTDRTKVSDDVGFYLTVVDDWIYYINGDDGITYKIRTDGTDRTKVNDDPSSNLIVAGDWIYYKRYSSEDVSDDSSEIYKIRTDGTDRTKIIDEDCGKFNVVDDWIYFTKSNEYFSIYRIRTDGTEYTRVNNERSIGISIVNDWIYYCNRDDNRMYRIRTDGSERQLVE